MEFVNGAGIIPNIWKIKFMFETTNQSLLDYNPISL